MFPIVEWKNFLSFMDVGMISYLLYNVFYCIIQRFSLIRSLVDIDIINRTSYIICVIVLFLCYLINFVPIKPSAGTTPCVKKYFLSFYLFE